MADSERHQHYVCTLDEARAIADGHERFRVSICGCRKSKSGCARSRADVCLQLREKTAATGPETRDVDRAFVEGIFAEAREKRLVPRPFRDARGETEGICFCCDDCCAYFTEIGNERCDKGKLIESTNLAICMNCGNCEDACRFGARVLDGELKIDRDRCYGCGLCVDACPEHCIKMVNRE
ncbi:MAG: ferredoxin [Methanocella sp. PtaU1.Bin125]|nr:MAG: ferredoxin [Methanocella sp. PtaU1.Bin125]